MLGRFVVPVELRLHVTLRHESYLLIVAHNSKQTLEANFVVKGASQDPQVSFDGLALVFG